MVVSMFPFSLTYANQTYVQRLIFKFVFVMKTKIHTVRTVPKFSRKFGETDNIDTSKNTHIHDRAFSWR
jgi:hypothetical protein